MRQAHLAMTTTQGINTYYPVKSFATLEGARDFQIFCTGFGYKALRVRAKFMSKQFTIFVKSN